MITAWSPRRIVRARTGAGPLLRVLALAVLLFGVLVTHGVHAESVTGHLSTSATAFAAPSDGGVRHAAVEPAVLSAADAEDHHGGHGPSHPGEHCLSGQPQQASALVSPCLAASVREAASSYDASTVRGPAAGGPMDGESSVALRAASVVRQV
ncbi:predicted protein [Streptomyces viridochromogenes DSM 40736]|uniref:Predicted protein n=1 Tax=Streptomyces viridochromogenes (strain DSM 40736 / JCM 4977 / BCRC 1201 / Tue 494) TaxID=591159 RepID=D9XBI4_STRVT|nr:predicted protein [Streptomyces viridochromogenes DSM 40736]